MNFEHENIKTLYKANTVLGEVINEAFINFKEYTVTGYTEKGFYILYGTKHKWVAKEGKKPFAFTTKEKALFSFIKTKERSSKIMAYYIAVNERVVRMAKEKLNSDLSQTKQIHQTFNF